jgi:hypothetical protein
LILRGAGEFGCKAGLTKRVGGARVRSRARLPLETPEGRNPREHPAVGELIPVRSPGTLGRVEAQKPWPVWAGPSPSAAGESGRLSGMWVLPPGNVADTFREEKAPKG